MSLKGPNIRCLSDGAQAKHECCNCRFTPVYNKNNRHLNQNLTFVIRQGILSHTQARAQCILSPTQICKNGPIPHVRHTTLFLGGLETFLVLANLADPGTRIQIEIQGLRYLWLIRIKPHTNVGSRAYLLLLFPVKVTASHRPAMDYA